MATTATRPRSRTPRARDRTPRPPAERLNLDALAASWLTALEASRAALAAALGPLGRREVGERSGRLAVERVETTRLLQALDRDLHAHSRLVSWLGTPGVTARMLGLPNDVAACVFDLDGVLTTSAEVHAAAWAETFDPLLLEQADRQHRPYIPFDRRHEYAHLVAGRLRLDGVRAFLASRGIVLPEGSPGGPAGTETVHGLANRKNELLQRRLAGEGVAAFEGSRCYLEAAHLAGLPCAVVSASANTFLILRRAGLVGLVDTVLDGNVLAAERLRAKPAPDTLLAACRRLGVEPARAVAFETTAAGLAAARAAGARLAVGVDRAGDADVLRAADADRVVGDLAELLRAVEP